MATSYDLQVDQGTTYQLVVGAQAPQVGADGNPVRDANNQIVYLPVNMTGWTGHVSVRASLDAPATIIDITDVANAQGQITFGNGFFKLKLNPTATVLLRNGYVYDVKVTDTAGDVFMPLRGSIKLNKAVAQ